ncbi:hypothetical protein P5G51_000410 [Virgibacillus sp. 179-BFC.A HS]|uniref:Uncharacterized protein n=1 Tax=Tigheibacillus jepli TaxID=3035914 RepID=A0ABU5CCM9_9BACI|nr:hypothetical protein [Virgibacillus sp. 179-BFC.A HS]MDY0404076.1 hypothetical protein [Virgibacillus sp. 179-BFC.A HS]
MGYEGFSIVGDSDFLKEQIRRAAQKTALRNAITEDMVLAFTLFEAYLEHAYATGNIPDDHLKIIRNVHREFDGEAKRALSDRFSESNLKMKLMNNEMENFIKGFHVGG